MERMKPDRDTPHPLCPRLLYDGDCCGTTGRADAVDQLARMPGKATAPLTILQSHRSVFSLQNRDVLLLLVYG